MLELQALDAELDRVAHRRRSLPELAEVARVSGDVERLQTEIVRAETELADLERDRRKADADVEQVRSRAARDQQRLDGGQVSSPRELENLQGELASLARRQQELEDVELEIMERAEALESSVAKQRADLEALRGQLTDLSARRDEKTAELDGQSETLTRQRAVFLTELPAALLELYDKLRAQHGGVGAAALVRGRCEGCRLELPPTEITRLRNAPEDEVLRCEECRRILVRTPESGL